MAIPTEAGWYVARMKTWPADYDWAIVKVAAANGPRDLKVWQVADDRPWPIEAWEWRCRLYPGLIDNPELASSSGLAAVR